MRTACSSLAELLILYWPASGPSLYRFTTLVLGKMAGHELLKRNPRRRLDQISVTFFLISAAVALTKVCQPCT